jgi:uncharacterized Ntn-hydrolase superfamily protein
MPVQYKLIALFLVLTAGLLPAQDTFSIVAVDESTGEIGSAGASCVVGAGDIGGVIIISQIIPGRGAINGQATICIPHSNLNNAIFQMSVGLSPQAILDWLYANDACQFGTNENRQYGIVDFDLQGAPRAAAFTGANALDYAGQRVGPNYAIQGNILLGPQILDSMEQRFLTTQGSLAEKLMAALQGANVPGADSRCLADGTSSTSAFLQVYKPEDEANAPYLRINVMETATGVEPIDSVQVLFDEWFVTRVAHIQASDLSVFPNPAADYFTVQADRIDVSLQLNIFDVNGRLLHQQAINSPQTSVETRFMPQAGVVFYQLVNEAGAIERTGKLLIEKN